MTTKRELDALLSWSHESSKPYRDPDPAPVELDLVTDRARRIALLREAGTAAGKRDAEEESE